MFMSFLPHVIKGRNASAGGALLTVTEVTPLMALQSSKLLLPFDKEGVHFHEALQPPLKE